MKQYYLIPVLLLFAVLIQTKVFAQENATVRGTVTDAGTGQPMYSATVYFVGTSIGAITDENGEYMIVGVPPGDYTLEVEYLGYEDYKKPMKIEAGKEYVENIKMAFSGGVDLEGVVITAQVEGQMRAINQQLQSNDIKNIVSSDRIRELPDANAAESVSRLPGVSLQRTGGEGNKVIIRGMSPKYNKIMVDGIDLAGTDPNDRSTSLNSISSYSLDGIEVIKSARADMEGDFVGGAVDFKLRTAVPGVQTELMAQLTYNNLKKDWGNYNLMASAGDRFFKNKLGIFGMVQGERTNRSSNTKLIGAEARSFDPENPDFVHYSLTLQDVTRIVKRINATLVLDYTLKNGSVKLSNFFAKRKVENETYSERYPTRDGTSDIYVDVKSISSDQTMYSGNLSYDQQFGSFIVNAIGAYSATNNNNPMDLNFNFNQDKTGDGSPVIENIPQDIHPDDAVNYANFDYHYLGFNNITYTPNTTRQGQYQGAVNLQWLFRISEDVSGIVKVGAKYRHQYREYEYDHWTGNFGASGNELGRDYYDDYPELFKPGDIDETTKEILYPYFIDPNAKPNEFMKGQFGPFVPPVDLSKLYHITNYMMNDYYPLNSQKDVVMHNAYRSNTYDYSGYEDYMAAYLMATFNFGQIVTLIPGVRFEQNQTAYTGTKGRSDLSGPNYYRYVDMHDTTVYRKNTFYLPNIHLKISPLDWLQFHLAYTHTLQRPNYSLIIPREDVSDGANNTYIINNTQLKPELSKNFDFVTSFHERYVGLFNVNLFYKKIEDKIFRDFTQPIGARWEELGIPEIFQGMQYSWAYNDTVGVELKGIEVDWQTSFWYLPSFLKGFVLNINYTYIKSKATYPAGHTEFVDQDNDPFTPDTTIVFNTPYEARLIDQPANILNVSLGYDYKGFSVRLNMRYQDNIFRATSFKKADRTFTASYLRFDISAMQKLPLGFVLFANFNNINDAKDEEYKYGSIDQYPTRLEDYGMTIDFGVRWFLSLNKSQEQKKQKP